MWWLTKTAAAKVVVVCESFLCKQMYDLRGESVCAVCMNYTTKDTHRVLSCGHFFCSVCTDKLVQQPSRARKCPICRLNIRKIN